MGHGFDLTAIPAHPVAVDGLTIGAPDAPAEREADRAADRVIHGEHVRIASGAAQTSQLERKCAGCDEEESVLRRDSGSGADSVVGSPAPTVVGEALAQPGRPLDQSVRADIEPQLGRSFSDVRVHDDALADRSARAVNARAYTVGRHIAFASGGYEPQDEGGRRLLIHELAHVVQQSASPGPATIRRYPYGTTGVILDRTVIANSAGWSYWVARTNERYEFLQQSDRMINDREEADAVLAALWGSNPPLTVASATEQLVAVQPPPPNLAARPRPTLLYRFRFSPPATAGGKPGLVVEFVREGGGTMPAAAPIPADFRTRDYWDLDLENLRSASRPAADRLGNITFPPGLPASERHAINYAISSYFDVAHARDTEVDALVPLDAGTRTLLVTLRFGPNNDVVVERIGESGTGAGQADTGRLDVTRVSGFPGPAATDAALRGWWRIRYPAGGSLTTPVPPAPATGAAAPTAPAAAPNGPLIAEMNSLIRAGTASATWFQGNYGMVVMDAAATATRLRRVHSVPAALVADTVNPAPADLVSLEIALQTIPSAELRPLRGVRVGRKSTSIERPASTWQAGQATQYGLTLTRTRGSRIERTIVYFDSLRSHDSTMFRGSTAAGAVAPSTMDMIHELGHAVERQGGVEAAFDAWLRAHPQATPTDYAATNLADELFPEFYALFHSDPHFLCGSAPLMYAWFTELARTGRAPRPRTTLTPPATCPP